MHFKTKTQLASIVRILMNTTCRQEKKVFINLPLLIPDYNFYRKIKICLRCLEDFYSKNYVNLT